ncbi:MAG: hypothetical protein KDD50_14480 [Bdellovibrionales bacterium]|nr:hypothetical protein [Bdellovibrionales bacterium]
MSRYLFFILLVIYVFFGSNAFSQVKWYEPKLKPSKSTGISYVLLIGKVEPKVSVEVNNSSLITIQYAQEEQKVGPRILKRKIKVNSKGFFKIPLKVPYGLYQLTINLREKKKQPKPILITMRVDNESVNLNVKVIRKTKILRIKEGQKKVYSLGLGLSGFYGSETSLSSEIGEYSLKKTDLLAPSFLFYQKLKFWKWGLNFIQANLRFSDSILDKEPDKKNSTYQNLSFGTQFRFNEKSNFWFSSMLDLTNRPILFFDVNSLPKITQVKVYRLTFGSSYLYEKKDFSIDFGLNIKFPVAVKVDSGEIVHGSNLTFALDSNYNFKINNNFYMNLGFSFEQDKYSVEYKNLSNLIESQEEETQLSSFLSIMMIYRWEKIEKPSLLKKKKN